MTTAERIKRARMGAGLTQAQLAQAAGVSSITVSRWERGSSEPRLHQFRRLADAAGVAISDLAPPEATTVA